MKYKPIRYLSILTILLLGTTGLFFQNNAVAQAQGQTATPSPTPLVSLNTEIVPITGSNSSTNSTNNNNAANATSKYGTFLVNQQGMPLYVYSSDYGGHTFCTGGCTSVWIPYTVQSSTYLEKAADVPGKLGTLQRSDGTLQLTYNNMALYTYSGDTQAGAPTGYGINGAWDLAGPDVYPGHAFPTNAPKNTSKNGGMYNNGGSYKNGGGGMGGY